MKIYVAFESEFEKIIVASFGCEQDSAVWLHQGVVEESDVRWRSFISPFSTAEEVSSTVD